MRRKTCKAAVALLAALLLAAGLAGEVVAATSTAWFTIANFQTSWNNEWVLVNGVGTVENPDGCPSTGLYSTQRPSAEEAKGLQLRNVTLLSAFLTGLEVSLVLDGCEANGRPSILGVYVRPPP